MAGCGGGRFRGVGGTNTRTNQVAIRNYQTKRGALASAPSGRLEVLVVNRPILQTAELAHRQLFLDDAWGDEDQQFRFVVLLGGLLEEVAEERNVTEDRYLGHVGAGGLFEDATQHGGVAVIHQNLCLQRLRID